MNTVVLGLSGILLFIWAIYWIDDRRKKKYDVRDSATAAYHRKHGGANNGGSWRNRTWKPNPGFNDEFAGPIAGTCGQIRPGEWQCNCAEPQHGCTTLERLKSSNEPAEEKTDKRGAIAAQKARKKNGS